MATLVFHDDVTRILPALVQAVIKEGS
jgi:hypothetical protein